MNGDTRTLMFMIEDGVDVNSVTLEGIEAERMGDNCSAVTPLHCAAWNGESSMVGLLLAATADATAEMMQGDVIRALPPNFGVLHHFEPQPTDPDAPKKWLRRTPAEIASRRGHAKVAGLLLQAEEQHYEDMMAALMVPS